VRHEAYERGLKDVHVNEDELIVVFVAPPWGAALNERGELDLRRTTPPVIEVVDRVAVEFGEQRLLLAVQLYEQVEPRSLCRNPSR
jgi:hypothetical protein